MIDLDYYYVLHAVWRIPICLCPKLYLYGQSNNYSMENQAKKVVLMLPDLYPWHQFWTLKLTSGISWTDFRENASLMYDTIYRPSI